MSNLRIIGILISDRIKESGRTQKLLSENARLIKSRLGFHEVSEDKCSRVGFILLQLAGSPEACDRLEAELNQIGGLEIQRMEFKY